LPTAYSTFLLEGLTCPLRGSSVFTDGGGAAISDTNVPAGIGLFSGGTLAGHGSRRQKTGWRTMVPCRDPATNRLPIRRPSLRGWEDQTNWGCDVAAELFRTCRRRLLLPLYSASAAERHRLSGKIRSRPLRRLTLRLVTRARALERSTASLGRPQGHLRDRQLHGVRHGRRASRIFETTCSSAGLVTMTCIGPGAEILQSTYFLRWRGQPATGYGGRWVTERYRPGNEHPSLRNPPSAPAGTQGCALWW